jgi:hypothetical protein
MTLLLLYLLALLDGVLCGLRTAMGRNARIAKRWYYLRATVRGLVGAQIVSMVALGALLLVALISSHHGGLRTDLESAAGRMLRIFLPYTALVLGSLALRALPSTDIRSASSVFLLGPLTAIRPLVMIAGATYGIFRSQLWETRALGLIILGLMLSLEFALNRWMARAQAKQIAKLVPFTSDQNKPVKA